MTQLMTDHSLFLYVSFQTILVPLFVQLPFYGVSNMSHRTCIFGSCSPDYCRSFHLWDSGIAQLLIELWDPKVGTFLTGQGSQSMIDWVPQHLHQYSLRVFIYSLSFPRVF